MAKNKIIWDVSKSRREVFREIVRALSPAGWVTCDLPLHASVHA